MARPRTEYHFQLPRRKRVGGVLCRLPLGLVSLGCFGVSVLLVLMGERWAWITALIGLFLAWGFLVAVTRFVLHKHEEMCLAITENGVGFGYRTPDWWLFADGITTVKRGSDGYWMLHHINGTYLYFPDGVVSHDDIAHLMSKKLRP